VGQVIFQVDLVEHKVVERRIWNPLTTRFKRFVVKNARDPEAVVEDGDLSIPLADYEGEDAQLRLDVSYQARCHPGDERRVAEALAGRPDPRKLVHQHLRFWVDQFIEDRRSFIDTYESRADALRGELRDQARRELGLSLKVRLRLVGRDGV